jgi:hypothetical protein
MNRGPHRVPRVRRAVGLAFLGATLGACVLADPPATLPLVPTGSPVIQPASVVPSNQSILVEWPAGDTFVVPVLLQDPTQPVLWQAFINDGPFLSNRVTYSGLPKPGNTATSENITTLDLPIPAPIGPGCFTVTIVVAFGWASDDLSAPDAQGGSSVHWFYTPNGACLAYDAGALAEARFPDAGDSGAL